MRAKTLCIGGVFCVGLMVPTPSTPTEFWTGFYKPTVSPAAPAPRLTAARDCLGPILDAQAQYAIPDNLLLAIGIQEAGRQVDGEVTVWPWSVNAEGRGIFFQTKEQAIAWVRTQQAQGVRSIDVGCMQINLHWHKGAFRSLEEAFDPAANAAYAARFLADLRRTEATWWDAAGSYHSRTDSHRRRYLSGLVRNHQVANAEYARLSSIAHRGGILRRVATIEKLPAPPVLWGATQEDDTAFSIYSRQALTPVLPVFQELAADYE